MTYFCLHTPSILNDTGKHLISEKAREQLSAITLLSPDLLPFKGGSFKAATKARCPIVPVALIDTYKAFDTGSIEPLTVQVHFLKPMYYDEYKDMKTTEIAAEVKRRVEETIKEYGGWN